MNFYCTFDGTCMVELRLCYEGPSLAEYDMKCKECGRCYHLIYYKLDNSLYRLEEVTGRSRDRAGREPSVTV